MTKKKVTTTVTTVTEEIVETTNQLTEIICILDRSGSMDSIISDMLGGFNTFLEEQKKVEGDCKITIVTFDHEFQTLYDNVDIKTINPITPVEWMPRGSTALHDAVGRTIKSVEARHALSTIKPDKVLVCVVTDGYENASREYTADAIKTLINKKEEEKWAFVYLAANQDAFAVGNTMGFKGGNTINFAASSAGAQYMNTKFKNVATYYRSTVDFSADTLMEDCDDLGQGK